MREVRSSMPETSGEGSGSRPCRSHATSRTTVSRGRSPAHYFLSRQSPAELRISQNALALRPPQRRVTKPPAERLFIECGQLGELHRIHARAGLECRFRGRRRAAIPRARLLAGVATEEPIAARRPKLRRNRAAQLDREVADALPRIEAVWLDQCAGRTGIEARAARAATVGHTWLIVRHLFGAQQGSQEKPTAEPLVDQHGVLADPAQAGQLAKLPFQAAGPCRPRRGPRPQAPGGDGNRPACAAGGGSPRGSRRPRHTATPGLVRRPPRPAPPCGSSWPA